MGSAEKQTDIARLWEEALVAYNKVTSHDLRSLSPSQRNVASIIMEQESQLKSFTKYRHKDKIDKLRNVISTNTAAILKVSELVSDNTSAVFPPGVAILTAFTYVMKASVHVSEDYNMVESFFAVMQSFFSRLSLLEDKVPPERAFQEFVVNVLSSVLIISAFAQSYREKGRFMKWAKALIEGNDDDLRKAYNTLKENLENLESAIMMRTLRSALETGEETKALRQDAWAIQTQVGRVQASLDRNTSMVQQNQDGIDQLLVGVGESRLAIEEVVVRTRGSETTSQELLRRQDDLTNAFEKMLNQATDGKSRGTTAGISKPAHLNSLKNLVRNPAEVGMAARQRDTRVTNIERMFEWIGEEPVVEDIIRDKEQFLWVSGNAGTGKSHLAYKLNWHVQRKVYEQATTAVACFFFDDEHREMRDVENMLRWCALKGAEKNGRYCEELLMDIRRKYNDGIDDLDTVWRALFESKFAKDSKHRLVLILDGLEQIQDEECAKLVQLLDQVKRDKMRIQVILTSDSDWGAKLSHLELKRIDLSPSKLAHDKKIFTRYQARVMLRLKSLRRDFRHGVIRKVSGNADSFLYIEHMMRRLNGLGGEVLIRKELKSPPPNIKALYEKLLSDCQKSRSSEDRVVLRSLLAWMAYAKAKLSIGEANKLIDIISQDNSITIEEELNGRLARLLRISGSEDRLERQNEDSEDESSLSGKEAFDTDDEVQRTEDVNSLLSFQERSLRAYFRQAIDDPDGLRCTAAQAHAIILKIISTVLTLPKMGMSVAEQKLVEYGAKWMFWHLLQIGDVQDSSDELARDVLESLFSILSNKNDSLKALEGQNLVEYRRHRGWEKEKEMFLELERRTIKAPKWRSADSFTIFNCGLADHVKVLEAVSAWAKRAIRLPPNYLSYGVVEWFRPYLQDPSRIYLTIAREHINNWFSSDFIAAAYGSFLSAHNALYRAKDLPAVRQNPRLAPYLKEFESNGAEITEKSFEVIADAFWDIVKSPGSFWGIGMAMKFGEFYNAAVKQLDIGLEDCAGDLAIQYRLQLSKGHALLELGKSSSDEETKQKYLTDALDTLTKAIDIFHQSCDAGSDSQSQTSLAKGMFQSHSITAALLGKYSLSLESITKATEIKKYQLANGTMSQLVLAFVASPEPGQVLQLLQLLMDKAKESVIQYFSSSNDLPRVEKAVVRAGKGQYMADLYKRVANAIELDDILVQLFGYAFANQLLEVAVLRIKYFAATFTRQALQDRKTAKTLLLDIIYGPQVSILSQRIAFDACNLLAQLLLDDFRLSTDSKVKKDILNETRSLLSKMDETTDNFDRNETHVIVPIALMLRKLGPAVEMAEVLTPAFHKCIEQLTDSTGANDSDALRRLARLLSCVPGFETDARIAGSAHMYVLNNEVYAKDMAGIESDDLNSESEKQKRENVPVVVPEADKALKINAELPETAETVPAQVVDGAADNSRVTTVDHVAEGDASLAGATPALDDTPNIDGSISCDACSKEIANWLTDGSAYLCVHCFDFDLCETCYKTKLARERGEMEPDWHVICPEGHQHIKCPVDDWKGLANGIMLIEDEEIPFKRWLADLEAKWIAYWNQYWSGV